MPEDMAVDFQTIIAKTLYVTKRARSDMCLSIAFLTTRVRAPNKDDWEKLHHLMEYLRRDHAQPLVLGAKNNGLLMWYIDALFAVHPNMHGHTGGGLTMMGGFPFYSINKTKADYKEFN
jgi:hypothetical protein